MYFIDVKCLQFLASGFAFSAFPVLATLLNAMHLLNEPIGIQTISLAALEDIVVWIVLAVASAFSSGGSALQGLYTLLLTLAFIAVMFVIVRPVFNRIHGSYLRREDDCNVYVVVGCFLLLVIAAFTTEVMGKYISMRVLRTSFSLGIHAFFGAFIAGLCIPRKGELIEFLSIRIELVIVEFFLP
jgi:Kef-type K+ transport system membrane component KefB